MLWQRVDERRNLGFSLFVSIALTLGARRGEIAALEWRDFDLSSGRVTFRETKNGTDRTVPMPQSVVEQVRAYRSSLGVVPLGTVRLFPHSYRHDWRCVERHLPAFRFHGTRHTAASYAAMSGASLLEIGTLLGHKTPAMARRYSHLSDEHTRSLVERVSARTLTSR